MIEALLVGAIVAIAAAYAVWALLPATPRLRLALRFGNWAKGPRRPAWLGRVASWVERAARARLGGCSDCDAAHTQRTPPRDRAER